MGTQKNTTMLLLDTKTKQNKQNLAMVGSRTKLSRGTVAKKQQTQPFVCYLEISRYTKKRSFSVLWVAYGDMIRSKGCTACVVFCKSAEYRRGKTATQP